MPMSKAITNAVLLEHMQGMRNALEERMDRLEQRVERGFKDVDRRFETVEWELQDAARHRSALQEDLNHALRRYDNHEQRLVTIEQS